MNRAIMINSFTSIPFSWRDYLELTKPKVVALMLLTVMVGMCMSTQGTLPIRLVFFGLLGIAMMSASAATINHVIDREVDAKMKRTHKRPVAQHRVSVFKASVFASILGGFGFCTLFSYVNSLTAWLTFASLLGYAVIYTLYLKRATSQNIVIGGLAGAMPPLLGWTAITGKLDSNAVLLVMIIFLWTPPHFWALAIAKEDEYAKAEIPVLSVTHGIEYTKTSILLYTLLLGIACLLPAIVGMTGAIYLIGSTILSALFFIQAWKLKYNPSKQSSMSVFKFSIYYLMLLFSLFLLDHYL
ncbi:protoheme IX farnesyltransferase [Parashewanella curva]|uniref:Protoheme IX farnesyltransferase n=1 Tax=Parashewanella curva TaxID=2338552 RepID=A0A3L8PYX0_9GAMM|nr:heme o synthase [Parashewanella curva]RLV59282.1 protoheme IX farnesyltransferase [Parashewanella curva]